MLSSKFISASVYNELPGINDNQAIPHATLRALGQLFAAFKVEQRVGVGLLHKHFKLAPDTIMVHDAHVCKPESIQSSVSVIGTSFFWDGTDFQAFEYAQGEPLNLPANFLDSLAGYLESHQLSSHISLSKLDTRITTSTESRDPEMEPKPNHDAELERASMPARKLLFMERLDTTTNSHIVEEAPYIVPRDATQWIFEGGVPVITHGCVRLYDGQGGYIHKRKVRYYRRSFGSKINMLFSKASDIGPMPKQKEA